MLHNRRLNETAEDLQKISNLLEEGRNPFGSFSKPRRIRADSIREKQRDQTHRLTFGDDPSAPPAARASWAMNRLSRARQGAERVAKRGIPSAVQHHDKEVGREKSLATKLYRHLPAERRGKAPVRSQLQRQRTVPTPKGEKMPSSVFTRGRAAQAKTTSAIERLRKQRGLPER